MTSNRRCWFDVPRDTPGGLALPPATQVRGALQSDPPRFSERTIRLLERTYNRMWDDPDNPVRKRVSDMMTYRGCTSKGSKPSSPTRTLDHNTMLWVAPPQIHSKPRSAITENIAPPSVLTPSSLQQKRAAAALGVKPSGRNILPAGNVRSGLSAGLAGLNFATAGPTTTDQYVPSLGSASVSAIQVERSTADEGYPDKPLVRETRSPGRAVTANGAAQPGLSLLSRAERIGIERSRSMAEDLDSGTILDSVLSGVERSSCAPQDQTAVSSSEALAENEAEAIVQDADLDELEDLVRKQHEELERLGVFLQ